MHRVIAIEYTTEDGSTARIETTESKARHVFADALANPEVTFVAYITEPASRIGGLIPTRETGIT